MGRRIIFPVTTSPRRECFFDPIARLQCDRPLRLSAAVSKIAQPPQPLCHRLKQPANGFIEILGTIDTPSCYRRIPDIEKPL